MSDDKKTVATPRPPMQRGPFGGAGMPAEKSMNFWPSAKRLLGRLRPHRIGLAFVFVLTVLSVGFSVIGPKLLGEGTNLIFEGVISKTLPAGVTKSQIVEGLRAQGQDGQADLLSGMHLTPGVGIDIQALSMVLLWVLALYVASSVFGWLQAYVLNDVVQRTVYRLRQDVEDKINRLPLGYYDRMQRGELLSRVTNDIDNVAQSLQQTLSQLLNSLLMVIGVMVMMFIVSPLLTLVALVTIPLTVLITAVVAKRSQKMFVEQWKYTGELNADIEENFTGHALVKVFGRQREVGAVFDEKNEKLYQASFGAQFVSGIIMPSMMFVGNLVYVGIAVVGGLQVANGSMRLGDVQAFIQYARQFTQPLTQLGSMANLAAVRRRLRGAGVRTAGCRGAVPRPRTAGQPSRRARAARVRERVVQLLAGQAAHRERLPHRPARTHDRHRGADRRGQDHPGKPHDALLRARFRADHPRWSRHRRHDPGRPAQPDGHGAAGHLAVRRHDPRQHRLRATGRQRGGDH